MAIGSLALHVPAGAPAASVDPSGNLTLLAAMTRGFARSGDFTEMVRAGLERITDRLGAEASSLFLLEGPGREIVCFACHGPVDITGLRLPWGTGIVGRCIEDDTAQMVRDVRADPAFAGAAVDAATGFVTRSILVAPLSVGDERLGAIEIINKATDGPDGDHLFTPEDQGLLEALCGAAALAISNMRLTARLVEQERLAREVELAAAIQRGLLPGPAPAEFPIHGEMRPMHLVSGDFWDVVRRPDGRLWFCVADVAGKGINAALLMAKTSSLFRCLSKSARHPGALLAAINEELCETASHGLFVTLACGLYDPADGALVLANAGHEPPLLHDPASGALESLPADGPPLGIAPGLVEPAAERSLVVRPGQALYVFTDGLTEASDREGAMLQADGLGGLIAAGAGVPVATRPAALIDAALAAGRAQRDDLTMLVLERPRGD
ncbi:PP2C family protein-serine/threonine phosphatase [Novispirillum sp. DQ9]|uniref:PP2C family protein-serine/threonine phosphatase n=1 Tax=Novispirillum sp. DQ9 TaxID=3398612 RepID=UPI003C7AEFA7